MSSGEKRNIVLPGDRICVVEEYLSGAGTYSGYDGWVRASVIGSLVIDRGQRVVVVKQARGRPFVPQPGDIVIGIVASMSEDLAFIDIIQIEGKVSQSTSFTGVIHISQASEKYVESLYEVVRLGDVVRAKVLNDKAPFQLTMKSPQLGVIAAMCSRCGEMLRRKEDDILLCPRCGNVEKRKTSIKYLVR